MGLFDKRLRFRSTPEVESLEMPEGRMTKEVWDKLPDEMRAVLPWNVVGEDEWGLNTNSGNRVSEDGAFKMGVVFAAVTLIADGVASLPPRAFTESEDGTRTSLTVPQWIRKPHPEVRRFDVFGQLLVSAITWGNGYAMLIRRPSDGVITGLQVLEPGMVHVEWDPNKPGYKRYRINGQGPWYTTYDIFHVQGPTKPGDAMGMSVIKYAREAIGLGLTLEEYGARYFGQGSQAKVVIELPNGNIDVNKAKDIIGTFERFHKGKNNWHRPAIVSGGAKLHQISIPPDDAQFLQSRDFQAVEIARWFRVPPHRVGIVSKSTSWGSGLAEENMAMLQHTYRPWIIRLQDALTAYAPGGQDLGTIIELDTAALLQGTFKEQADIWVGLYEKQVVTKNEARQKLGLPKVDDGDKFMEPAQAPGPNSADSPGEGGRTQEQDRLRKQEEAARSAPDLFEILEEEFKSATEGRHLPGKHDQSTHGHGHSLKPSIAKETESTLEGKITTGSTAERFPPGSAGAKALEKLDKEWGIGQADIEEEFRTKVNRESLERDGKWFSAEAHAFNSDLARRSGLTLEQTTAITSLTSPRNPWVKNKEIAERIAMKYKDYDGMDPKVAAKKMGGYMSANMAPAISVARGDMTPDQSMTGIKRRSFYNNMLHPHQTSDVTVDTWMQRSAMNAVATKRARAAASARTKLGRELSPEELQKAYDDAGVSKPMSLDDSLKYLNASKASTGAGAGYIRIADASRKIAEEFDVAGDEIQSTYWVAASGHREGLWGKSNG